MLVRTIDERRGTNRYGIEKNASYIILDEFNDEIDIEFKIAPIKDISKNGALIVLPEKPKIGDVIKLELCMEEKCEKTISVMCEVVSTRWAEVHMGFATGINFIIVKEDDREIIESFIIEHRLRFI